MIYRWFDFTPHFRGVQDDGEHGAWLDSSPLLTLHPDVLHSSGECRPRLRLGIWARKLETHPGMPPASCAPLETTRACLQPRVHLCGTVGRAVAVQRGARLSRGSDPVTHREAGGQVRGVGHVRAQHILLLVRPPSAPASTGIAPPHSSPNLRRAQVYDGGADAHGPRPWNPLPGGVRHYVRGEAGHVPPGAQC